MTSATLYMNTVKVSTPPMNQPTPAVTWKWLPRSQPATTRLPSTIRLRGMGAASSSLRAPLGRSTMTPIPAKVQVSGMSSPTVPTMTKVL